MLARLLKGCVSGSIQLMPDLKQLLKTALEGALHSQTLPPDLKLEIVIQETPSDKPGVPPGQRVTL